jgi:polyphosphate kinase
MTSDNEIGEDVSDLFNSLSGFSKKAQYRKLAVAPTSLHTTLLEKIEAQTARAKEGKRGYVFAKLNALVELPIIQALYRASRAGVTVDLCIRGICCLRPGVPGVSENIRVSSILGRFLEHSRIMVFGPPGEEEIFLSSADWMPRNLHRRVELLVPVASEPLRELIRREIVRPALADNSRAFDMDAEGRYARRECPADAKPRSAQADVLAGTLDDAAAAPAPDAPRPAPRPEVPAREPAAPAASN